MTAVAESTKTQPTTEKSDRTVQSIAKKDRQTREEYRLQFTQSGLMPGFGDVNEGDYTPRVYKSQHAAMCAQSIHNGYEQPAVRVVVCEVEAVRVLREVESE